MLLYAGWFFKICTTLISVVLWQSDLDSLSRVDPSYLDIQRTYGSIPWNPLKRWAIKDLWLNL